MSQIGKGARGGGIHVSPVCPVCAEITWRGDSGAVLDARCPKCDAALVLHGHYVLDRLLGGGGQGHTFAGLDTRSGERVAIKELSLAYVRDWKQVDLFRRQADVLAGLSHAQIPRFITSFEEERSGVTFFYLVTELIDGESLAQEVARGMRFDEAKVIEVARAVCDVLEHLHAQSPPIIHRDVKPSNLMRRRDGQIVLVDFGLVRDTAKAQGGSTVAAGTPGYAPIEQFTGFATPATDLYALGATMVALLARREPAEMMRPGDIRVNFRPHVNVSEGVADLLARLLDPDPANRPQSANELREALRVAVRRPAKEVPPAVKKKVKRILGLGLVLPLVFPLVFATPFCPYVTGEISGYHDLVMRALRGCPEARTRLGADIGLQPVGCMATGKTSCGGSDGRASWNVGVSGGSRSGDYRYTVVKEGGPWKLMRASLEVSGHPRLDVLGCASAAGAIPAENLPNAPTTMPARAGDDIAASTKAALDEVAKSVRKLAEDATARATADLPPPPPPPKRKRRTRRRPGAVEADVDTDDEKTSAKPAADPEAERIIRIGELIPQLRAAIAAAEPPLDGPRPHFETVRPALRLQGELRRLRAESREARLLIAEVRQVSEGRQGGRFPIRNNRLPPDVYRGADVAELKAEALALVRQKVIAATPVRVHIEDEDWKIINRFRSLKGHVVTRNRRGRYWVYRMYWRRYPRGAEWTPRTAHLPNYSPYGVAPEHAQ